jgi:hypothetical protein
MAYKEDVIDIKDQDMDGRLHYDDADLVTLITFQRATNVCCVPRAANVFAECGTQNSKILLSHDILQTQCSANLYGM